MGTIDILINNAGAMLLKAFNETILEDCDFLQKINVHGPFVFCKAVVPSMQLLDLQQHSEKNNASYLRMNTECPGPTVSKMTEDFGLSINRENWLVLFKHC